MSFNTMRDTFAGASMAAMTEAGGFGLALGACAFVPHLCILGSRWALGALPAASACVLAVLCVVASVPQARRALASRWTLPCACAATCAALLAFAVTYSQLAHSILSCVMASALTLLLMAWIVRLGGRPLRDMELSFAAGIVSAGAYALVTHGASRMLDLAENTANFTQFSISAWALAMALSAAASFRPGSGERSRDRGKPGSGPRKSEASSEKAGNAEEVKAPARTLLATVCVTCLATTLYDGMAFNPYVYDLVRVDAVSALIMLACGSGFLLAAMACPPHRAHDVLFATTCAFLALGVAGIVALSVSFSEGTALALSALRASCALLAADALLLSCCLDADRLRSLRIASVAALFCGMPWSMAAGIALKRTVGWTAATITPIALLAVSLLSVAALMQNARAAHGIVELKRMQARETALLEQRKDDEIRRLKRSAPDEISKRTNELFDWYNLTERQEEATRLAMHGLTIDAIAKRMFVVPKTVSFHLNNVYEKMGISGKADLVKLANEIECSPGDTRSIEELVLAVRTPRIKRGASDPQDEDTPPLPEQTSTQAADPETAG